MIDLDTSGFEEAALAFERGNELLESDPLALFHTTSEWQRRFIAHLRYPIYAHPANKSGKTTTVVACALALGQGREELDGIPLPRLPSPCVGAIFSLDYKQQRLAVQETLLRWLGRWPHKLERDGETIVSIALKPGFGPGFRAAQEPSDDPRTWTKIGLYSQKNLASGVGFRLHFAAFDEPPVMPVYREVMKAGFPGWPFPTFIGATSIKRSQWYPLRAYFPTEDAKGQDTEDRLVNGVIRISGSVYENTALQPADIADLERRYAPDPDRMARLYGHEINTEGLSPFRANLDELNRWMEMAEAPREVRPWKVSREVTTDKGREVVEEVVDVEIYDDAMPGHRYRGIADPSMGIDDSTHDPGENTVWDLTVRPVVDVASYSGFLGEYGLGVLAASMARAYNEALVDPDTTGGLGGGFLGGLRASKYARVVNHRTGKQEMSRLRIGFVLSTETRMQFAAAINEALYASKMGKPFMRIRNPRIIADLLDMIVDAEGRPITPPGTHDEGFITAGRIATLVAPDKRVETPKELRPRRGTIRQNALKAYYERTGQEMPRPERKGRPKPNFGMAR